MPVLALRYPFVPQLWLILLICATASPAAVRATTYALATPPSSLDVGCYGPCACPIVSLPTYGSFELIFSGSDPLYDHYDVLGYIASFNHGPGAVAITGSGKFRIGGEVALVQQLTLDLQIQGQPLQHFDSGLVPVGAPFPGVSVSCAVHGFGCLDSVLNVNARPVDLAGNLPLNSFAGLERVWPNPFAGMTRITFSLTRAGTVTLEILDLGGRRVRVLAASDPEGSGPATRLWDGRREDGRPAPPGVYWVRLMWPGGVDQRRVIKLE